MMRQMLLGMLAMTVLFIVTSCNNVTASKKSTQANVPPPPPPGDTTAPAVITGITVIGVTHDTATIRWIATGDDGNVGTASGYVIRYYTSPINAGNWSMASIANVAITPLPSGQVMSAVMTGLTPETTYYFIVTARDEAFNWSPIPFNAVGTTDSPPPPPPPQLATLTVRILNTTPTEHQINAGASDVVVASIELSASPAEAIVVEQLRLFNAGTAPDDAIIQVRLAEGVIVLASAVVIDGYTEFTGLNLIVSAGGSRSIDVVCNFATSNDVPTISGKTVWFGISNLEDDWQQGAAPGATNDSFNGMGETGDIKAVGQVSGMVLLNSSDPASDQIIGDCGVGNNLGDGVGFIDRGGNILTKKQHLIVNAPAIAFAANQPVGFQGFATGAKRTIGLPNVSASQIAAPAPQELELLSLTITINGDAEAEGFELYGDDPFNPIATSAVVHRTTKAGGDPANPADHISMMTTVTFVLQGLNRFIPYGTQKSFTIRAKVYALTDAAIIQRSLKVSIASFGTPDTAGDLTFRDNGDVAANPDSFEWSWIDGLSPLEPTAPMEFSGTAFIP